jgi:hypothetical protein
MLDQMICDYKNNIEEAVAQTIGNLRLMEDAKEASASRSSTT